MKASVPPATMLKVILLSPKKKISPTIWSSLSLMAVSLCGAVPASSGSRAT
mgnify:CR=1 FL=1